jgi:hypothetical protein
MTPVYMTDQKDGYVLRKLPRGLSVIESWCERWNIKVDEDKIQAIYFSHKIKSRDAHLTFNGRNIPFVNHANISVQTSMRGLHGDCT